MITPNQPNFITLKIDVTKILKDEMYHSTKPNPKNGGKCPVYLDCAVFANKDGQDDYGNTHYIVQNLSKETRAKDPKARGPIIGNAKVPVSAAKPAPAAKAKAADLDESDEDGAVPF
jgi:hypothetical protein